MQIEIKKIAAHNITVTADETGTVYINGISTSRPVMIEQRADIPAFVWAPAELGLVANTKIGLEQSALDKITAHSATFVAAQKELARKAKIYDAVQNEGYSDGFNPYR